MRHLVAVLLLLQPSLAAAQRIVLVPMEARVPQPPSPVPADGKVWLNYELVLTNVGPRDLGLAGLEVLTRDGRVVHRLERPDMASSLTRFGGRDSTNPRVIGAGKSAVLFLWMGLAPGAVPTGVRHRILTTRADSLETAAPDTLLTGVVEVLGPAVTLGAPLRGGPWVAGNGPGNLSGHRRTRIPLEGSAKIAQRFATDWLKYGPDGRAWQGDSTVNANWYGHGEPLLAVADGQVVAIKDGIPENVPLTPERAVPITLETVGGNYVIVDIGGGRFAFYAHLVPGSVAVQVGDRVRRGQVLGKLGNSGNSDAPHLHFHLGDGPTPLGSEGLPFTIDRFEQLGKRGSIMEALMKPWLGPGDPADVRRGELPLDNAVVRFP
ncbi:MAG TPA: M23 family metallopeptidase [Gemmatimonadales bacterium]